MSDQIQVAEGIPVSAASRWDPMRPLMPRSSATVPKHSKDVHIMNVASQLRIHKPRAADGCQRGLAANFLANIRHMEMCLFICNPPTTGLGALLQKCVALETLMVIFQFGGLLRYFIFTNGRILFTALQSSFSSLRSHRCSFNVMLIRSCRVGIVGKSSMTRSWM